MYIFLIWNKEYSDRTESDLSDETIRIKKKMSVEGYDEKTAENYRNRCVTEKRIVSNLWKISIQILIALIVDFNEDCLKISCPYLLYFPRNKVSNSVTL